MAHQREAPRATRELLIRLTWFTIPGFEHASLYVTNTLTGFLMNYISKCCLLGVDQHTQMSYSSICVERIISSPANTVVEMKIFVMIDDKGFKVS